MLRYCLGISTEEPQTNEDIREQTNALPIQDEKDETAKARDVCTSESDG